MTRRRGIARWLNRLKGFGFIEAEQGCVEVFTHYTQPDSEAFEGLYRIEPVTESGYRNKLPSIKLRN